MRAVLRKELQVYFSSATAYVVLAGLPLFASAWFFSVSDFFGTGMASLRAFYGIMPFALVISLPALSMRMWSEERREGTDEVLFVLPVSDLKLVVAKFSAAMIVVIAALGATLLVPLSLAGYGALSNGEGLSRYIGLVGLAAAILSVGQLLSAVTKNQIVSFLSTAVLSLSFTLVGAIETDGVVRDAARFLSFDVRYADFARGLVSTDDLGFYAGFSALLTLAAVTLIDRRRGRVPRRRRIRHLLLGLLIVLTTANLSVFRLRIDTTRDRVHTLAQATTDLLSSLEDQVSITYAISDRLRDQFPAPEQIVDLLREYERTSRGRVSVRTVDPVASDRTAEFEEAGVIGQQLEVTEAGEQTLALVYSGIVVEYLDRRTVLPFVFSTDLLEYDVTRSLRDLVRDGNDRAIVIDSADPGRTPLATSHSLLLQRIGTGFDVEVARADDPVPDDVDVVIVPAAHELPQSAVAGIASYLNRGGSVLIAVDTVSVSIDEGLEAGSPEEPPILALLMTFGIELRAGLMLDVNAAQIPVEEVSGGFRVARLYPYPYWIEVERSYTSDTHPITRRFGGLTLYWPSSLELADGGTQAEIVAATSPDARSAAEPFTLGPLETSSLFSQARPTGQRGLVAVASDETSGGRVAVVADGDFMSDELIRASNSAYNLEFAMSAAEWLSANEALLEIRTRSAGVRELTHETAILSPAAVMFLNLVLLPLGIALAGIIRIRRRQRVS